MPMNIATGYCRLLPLLLLLALTGGCNSSDPPATDLDAEIVSQLEAGPTTPDAAPKQQDRAAPAPCPPATGGVALPFREGFETYPEGPLVSATGSPWVRANQGREGNVSRAWVKSGSRNFEIYSFTTSTEVHYVKLALPQQVGRIDIELWYTPDGFFIYKDFADFGLGCALSKFELKTVIRIRGSDHKLLLAGPGDTATELTNEVDYGKGPAMAGNPASAVHNYVRLELDFAARELRTFQGPTSSAPLKSKVPLPTSLTFNAFFLSGGLNPTYLDDISITAR
jgi:hypothetical protein